MATLAFSAFAIANNTVCNPSPASWFTLPLVPLVFTIPILLLALGVAVLLLLTSTNRFNSTDGIKSYKKSYGYTVLFLYLAVLVMSALYKAIGCQFTYPETMIYSDVSNLISSGGIAMVEKRLKRQL